MFVASGCGSHARGGDSIIKPPSSSEYVSDPRGGRPRWQAGQARGRPIDGVVSSRRSKKSRTGCRLVIHCRRRRRRCRRIISPTQVRLPSRAGSRRVTLVVEAHLAQQERRGNVGRALRRNARGCRFRWRWWAFICPRVSGCHRTSLPQPFSTGRRRCPYYHSKPRKH